MTAIRVIGFLVVGLAGAMAQPASKAAPQPTARFTMKELMSDVATLTAPEMEGRGTGAPGNARARAHIVNHFRRLGLTPLGKDYQMPFRFTRGGVEEDGVNLVALCRGKGAKDKGVMVISAHYDHLGVRDGQVYPGADDNASGVAVLVALARQCRQTPWTHDAVFAAFDAEELGLHGARAFVSAPPLPRERIRLNVNFDMISRSDKRELYVAGIYHRPDMKPALDSAASRAPITLLFGHDQPAGVSTGLDDWTTQSDHGAFHAVGIPFVYFGVEDHADYHQPTDTADKINPQFFFQAATTILDAVTALDRALPAPKP